LVGKKALLSLLIVTVGVAVLAASLYLPQASPPVSTGGRFFVEDADTYIGRNPLSMRVDLGSLNDGDIITLGNVTFTFRRPPSTQTTVVNLTTRTVTSTRFVYLICPEYFHVAFEDGTSAELYPCTTRDKVSVSKDLGGQMYQLTGHDNPRAGLLVKVEPRVEGYEVRLLVSIP
jgi:hypothetical protein